VDGNQALARLVAAPELPVAFVRRVVEVAPGSTLAVDPVDWCGAVVVVREGVVHLRLRSGVQQRFATRDVLWLAGLDVRDLHNPGPDPAVLVSVRRRCDA